MIAEIFPTMQRPLLTTEQVAKILNADERNVQLWLRSGELVGIKVGREWRVDPADLEEYIQRRRQQPRPSGE